MGRYSLGVTDHPFRPDNVVLASIRARDLGFEHIDIRLGVDAEQLALPVGYFMAHPDPRPGRTMAAAPPQGPGEWERAVELHRAAPGCLIEPVRGSIVDTLESAVAFMREVPGLRLSVDTAHVASWGGDPVEWLDHADHIQLRQGAPGRAQLHVDDPDGTVDFAAVLRRLDMIGYPGVLTIEHFNIPQRGYVLDDVLGWTLDLQRHIRRLMA